MSFPGDGPCMFATGPCCCCRRIFAFNPDTVPSSTALTGTREPICETCIRAINEKRRANGLEPWPIPPGAYDVVDLVDAL